MSNSNCPSCKHCNRSTAVAQDKTIQTNFLCVRYPPVVVVVMHQTALGVQQMITPVYPAVNEQSIPCSEYNERVTARIVDTTLQQK